MAKAFTLVVASHRGGTGRTTAALALAWSLGQRGTRVLLADAAPDRAASLIAGGDCRWPNVTVVAGPPPADADAAIVVVDAPTLPSPDAAALLARAGGVLLTALPDPLTPRTLPAATAAVRTAQAENPHLRLLGLLVPLYNDADPLQDAMLSRLRDRPDVTLLEPSVPADAAVRDWPLAPGSPLPAGPARVAYQAVALRLSRAIRHHRPT